MKRGTYVVCPKPGVDFEGILLKENEEAKPSLIPDSPILKGRPSESSVQPQESPRPSLEDAAPEDQDVSFSSCDVVILLHSGHLCLSQGGP